MSIRKGNNIIAKSVLSGSELVSVLIDYATNTALASGLSSKVNNTDLTTFLAEKADVSTTYTKTQTDNLLSAKVDTSDSTVTKQGNTFNGASQLVQLTSTGKLPTIDGSLLTGLTEYATKTFSNITQSTALTNLGFAGQSLTTNGYYKLPNGLIIQWGIFTTSSGGYANITFPTAFTNALLSITGNINSNSASNWGVNFTVASKTTTTIPCAIVTPAGAYGANQISWIAIGY